VTAPLILGLGGTTAPVSSSERAVRAVLRECEALGARVQMFDGPAMAKLPHYSPAQAERSPEAQALVDAFRMADGVVIGSPGYHGSLSGLCKNALDYTEDLRGDSRCYLDGLPVGCVVTAAGWQAVGTTLTAMRSVVHALRGWPTPAGIGLNSAAGPLFDAEGALTDPLLAGQFRLMAAQLLTFATRMRRTAAA
jgi:FMN reductase